MTKEKRGSQIRTLTITFRFSPTELAKAREVAEAESRTVASLVRSLISDAHAAHFPMKKGAMVQ